MVSDGSTAPTFRLPDEILGGAMTGTPCANVPFPTGVPKQLAPAADEVLPFLQAAASACVDVSKTSAPIASG